MEKIKELFAVVLVIVALLTCGNELLSVLKDTLGYVIYLTVFTVPVIYYSIKKIYRVEGNPSRKPYKEDHRFKFSY